MKTFETPSVEVRNFDVADVLTTSGLPQFAGDNCMGL